MVYNCYGKKIPKTFFSFTVPLILWNWYIIYVHLSSGDLNTDWEFKKCAVLLFCHCPTSFCQPNDEIYLTWDLYYKTLRIRNLRESYNFFSKLASSGLDKHASLDKQTRKLTTESILYKSIIFTSTCPEANTVKYYRIVMYRKWTDLIVS